MTENPYFLVSINSLGKGIMRKILKTEVPGNLFSSQLITRLLKSHLSTFYLLHFKQNPDVSKNITRKQLTRHVRFRPPLSFLLKMIFGGSLFNRMPNPSSSRSKSFLCINGFITSNTISIREHVRATKCSYVSLSYLHKNF